jgi:predicted nucleic acid-binding protein
MPSKLFCWDSVTFISVLNGGVHRSTDEISGLHEVIDMVERRQARIVTSEIILAEVLDNAPQLEALFRRPEYFMVSTGGPIMRKVRDLRSARRSLKTPDATYIATALAYKADELHTFDGQLLRLSGASEVEGLRICKPTGTQTTLNLGV